MVVPGVGGSSAAADACTPSVTPVAVSPGIPWTQTTLRVADLAPFVAVGAAPVKVAVLDSGIDVSAPQLAGAVDVAASVSVVDPKAYPPTADALGHGTMVAGIIAARARPGVGVVGLAPSVVSLLSIRAYRTCETEDAPLARGIREAVARGARIVNVSAGTSADTPDLAAAVRAAQDAGVLIVAAAGNLGDQRDGDPPQYPAAYPGVVAVAATGPDRAVAGYSEHGPYVGLTAPGGTSQAPVIGIGPGASGTLAAGIGTSFAAPFVTATAALVWSRNPGLTAAQVRQRLYATADRMAAGAPDESYGWGVVDPYAALTEVAVPDPQGPTTRSAEPLTISAVRKPSDTSGRALVIGGGGILSAGAVAGARRLVRRRRPGSA
ncbi:S8 family serine peptidase [Catenulispora yoronensis]